MTAVCLLFMGLIVGCRHSLAAEPARTRVVDDAAQLARVLQDVVPGDTIVLRNGIWRDVNILLRGRGTSPEPITLRAETPGGVQLVGRSSLRIAGEYLVVEGLWFRDCRPEKGEIVSFRGDSKNLAHHSTLRQSAVTETAMTTSKPGKSETKWVSLYGHDNVVEHCEFTGKTSAGALLVVWLPDLGRSDGVPVRHRIERNYFGPRSRLGKNGGETIRIGDSDHSLQSAACLVAENRFERCDGEVECVSNKSCDNIFRGNTFWECQGTLTLRHGHGCLVEGNVFLGNQRRETGGIRIIGERHRVVGNYLQGVMGDEARSAICLMSGQADPPLNGYSPVRDCQILGNTLIDCRHGLTIGYADQDVQATVPPSDCLLADNLVAGDAGTSLEFLSSGATLTWRGNFLAGRAPAGSPSAGIRWNERPTSRAKPPTMERSDVGPVWKLGSPSDTRPSDTRPES